MFFIRFGVQNHKKSKGNTMKQYDLRLLLVALAGLTILATPAAALVCGDSEPDPSEECDDGNTVSGDGCSATCTVEAGFDCSEAVAGIIVLPPDPSIPPVPSQCLAAICGDSIESTGETCDDGNSVSGDGCSSTCSVEIGFGCTAAADWLDVIMGSSPNPSNCAPDDVDEDNDNVSDGDDVCPNTIIPESVPSRSLKPNRWALVDGDVEFDTALKGNGNGPNRSYTTTDMAGCSCEQIIAAQGLGDGHKKHGCSISAMDDWVELVTP